MNRKVHTTVRALVVTGALVGGAFAIPTPASAAVISCQSVITSEIAGKAICLVTGNTKYWVKITCAKIAGGQQRTVLGTKHGMGGPWSTASCLSEEFIETATAQHS